MLTTAIRRSLLAIAFVCFPTCGSAQETRSMIFGHITDPQSSAVPSAQVTITNLDNNTSTRLATNETGYYEAGRLLPGNYRITVEAQGFKKTIRSGITLPVSSRIEVSLRLEVGAVQESVSVTAEAPLLDTNVVAAGRVIDNRSVMDLPVLANSPLLLARMAPGVQTGGVLTRLGLHSNLGQGGYDIHVGGNIGGNEYSIDGVPNMTLNRRAAQLPYADTIQEFKVETANFDASVGHTSNVAVIMMTRTGGNQLRGTATFKHWQQRWQGAGFFVKQLYYRNIAEAEARGDTQRAAALRAENITPSGRYNNPAVTIGGPVVLPRIYNGKDRLFFYVSAVGVRSQRSESGSGGTIVNTIPTLSHRRGDFSDLLNVDATRYQIYDPLTVRPDPSRPGHFVRDPIPGNVLPANRIISPIYKTYSGFLPTPNNNPLDPRREPTQNYLAVGQPNIYTYYAVNHRMDYHHSGKHRFFGKWTWNEFNADTQDWTYEVARGLMSSNQNRNGIGATADWVYTISPTSILDVAVAGNTFADGTVGGLRQNYKPSDVGLPAYMDTYAGAQHILPIVSVSGYSGFGRGYPSMTRAGTMSARADLTLIRGTHSLRSGMDVRMQQRTGGGGGSPSGSFGFDNTYTRRNDDSFTPAGALGHSWAAFLMGIPTSMSVTRPDTYALSNPYYAWYFQDNWRITRKLTLNLGLRMEFEQGGKERFDRALAGFDPSVKLPISDGAESAYRRNPIAELSAITVRGGSLYAGKQGASRKFTKDELMWLPRLSASYQLGGRTVLRGGYGIYYDTINVMNRDVNQLGYGASTGTILTTDFGMRWLVGNPAQGVSPLTDPFPLRADGTRFNVPYESALGYMAVAGTSYTFWDYDTRRARQQRWRIGVQRQIGASMVVEGAYSGSFSDRVYVDKNLNPLPERFWATGMVRNDAVANNMNANVASPFRLSNFAELSASNALLYQELGKRSLFTSSTIRKNMLLRPYPHLSGLIRTNAPFGEARTHDLQLSLERRFSKGFNLNVAYTRLKSRAKDSYWNEFDPEPYWAESNNGRPHRFTATSVFELPFGKGRALAREGVWSVLAGGFQISATYEWQPGPLITFGNLFYYGDLKDIRVDRPTLERWFNTDKFERTASKGPAAFHVRVFPVRVEGLRADRTNNWNVNLQREFRIAERMALQFRLDCMNLQNRSQFDAPTTNPYSTNFGRVTTQTAAMNRFIEAQVRIRF